MSVVLDMGPTKGIPLPMISFGGSSLLSTLISLRPAAQRQRALGMTASHTFLMAGGGTGGHVIPALAVAHELEKRGHRAVFVGTHEGFEAKLVPAAGYEIEWISVGGLKGVGAAKGLRTLAALPGGVWHARGIRKRHRPAAVFSMGGYVAGPVTIAAALRGLPIVAMEPNAVPGFTNRRMARFICRALISFPETARFFPKDRAEVTGVPVRRAFFDLPPKPQEDRLTILITGGSRGSRTLNNAARQSWPLFLEGGPDVRIIHQTGSAAPHEEIATISRAPVSMVAWCPSSTTCRPRSPRLISSSAAPARARSPNSPPLESRQSWFPSPTPPMTISATTPKPSRPRAPPVWCWTAR